MNECASCGKDYPDHAKGCPLIQESSVCSALPPTTGRGVLPDKAWRERDKAWRRQVLVPAVLWLVAFCFLAVAFTVAASFMLGLVTAVWAAIDSSRLQPRGSRLLGIAFKPVVVFAACAFFLWGFGFIWYLVMRHRVKTAPVDLKREGATTVC